VRHDWHRFHRHRRDFWGRPHPGRAPLDHVPLGDRPHWWPANEPWPPADRRELWARGRRRFARRAGILLAVVLFLSAMGLISMVSAVFDGTGAARWWSGPIPIAPLAILAGTYLFFFVAMRRVGTPLGDIVSAADRVASGDYEARVTERGTPFLRRVARAFNAMTATLQAQDRQRRELMADIAHELRTPLTIVQGRLEGLVDGVYPRDEAQLTEVLEETRMLARLVDDLRTLANAEAGNLSLHKEPTDLAVVIYDAVESFAADAVAARIALSVDERTDLPLIDVDPLRVREILINLLANALRHTSAGGTITIAAGVRGFDAANAGDGTDTREPRMIDVSVSDTGSGIAPADLPRIFDRFYKGSTSRGSGLGLAIVRNLVIAHGGDVTAASELGRGTTITFTLPVSQA
jgi:signal transduction histidine kinase